MSTADTSLPGGPPPEASQPKLSEVERIVNIYTAPSKTFADIKRSAMWITPWLLMLVTGTVFCFTVGQRVGWEQVMQNNMRMAPAAQQERMDQLPADQKPLMLKRQLQFTKIFSYGFPVMRLFGYVIVALVLWGTFSFGVGSDVRFGQALAIVMYAALPFAVLRGWLAILVLWLKAPEDFFIQNAVGTNIGHFLPFADTPRFLYSIATEVDLFMVWTIVLTGIGFSVVGKVKQGTAYAVVFGWWAVFMLAAAGIGAAFA
jgi:hypothetical protein